MNYDLPETEIDELIISFQNAYVGRYEKEEDFAFEIINSREDITEFVKQYFDYSAYARELFSSEYWSEEGYVYYNS